MTAPRWAIPAGAALAALAACYIYRDDFAMARRGGAGTGRSLAGAATTAHPLDARRPMITPDELIHFGPAVIPSNWVRHRMTYGTRPGQELERLIYGAPGAGRPPVPASLRGWLYDPPAEQDY